ncbi:methyltransferase domain-containing protein [Nocardioides sp. TF02-7]|uniref:class I SAM-dependent methyltransferase n=1 Tax=Nocardioides sp. TF02-7 TaxID=2917724 RepID=UPI001F05DC3C|nr:methyltransferase domain-containing protein [Nocardioides sp. TF02-7]UMG92152.1 class I SAM-dependent methyltransferase [Nocardioides sp. TF02-7]
MSLPGSRAVRGTRERLRSFRERRIDLPVGPDDLVLDVGSGDKPSWRADVLLDRYPDDAYAGQRSGTGRTRVVRPLFDADAAAMPFADGVFDYAICSHVLEHVTDPVGVVRELTRVARAGYIEVPEAAAAKIVDFPQPPLVVPPRRLDPAADAGDDGQAGARLRPRDRGLPRPLGPGRPGQAPDRHQAPPQRDLVALARLAADQGRGRAGPGVRRADRHRRRPPPRHRGAGRSRDDHRPHRPPRATRPGDPVRRRRQAPTSAAATGRCSSRGSTGCRAVSAVVAVVAAVG